MLPSPSRMIYFFSVFPCMWPRAAQIHNSVRNLDMETENEAGWSALFILLPQLHASDHCHQSSYEVQRRQANLRFLLHRHHVQVFITYRKLQKLTIPYISPFLWRHHFQWLWLQAFAFIRNYCYQYCGNNCQIRFDWQDNPSPKSDECWLGSLQFVWKWPRRGLLALWLCFTVERGMSSISRLQILSFLCPTQCVWPRFTTVSLP